MLVVAAPHLNAADAAPEPLREGVVLAPDFGPLYAPVDRLAASLELPLGRGDGGKRFYLGAVPVPAGDRRAGPLKRRREMSPK